MIGDYKGTAIRRDVCLDWLLPGACNGDFASTVKINNTDAVGAVVSNVGPMPGRVDSDEVWLMMN